MPHVVVASNGYRVIAHDRRGHGGSTQTWHGNEMDTYADDLAAVIDHLDLRDATRDLDAFDVPTLVIHGDADQVVPFSVGGAASAARIKDARLTVYPGAPHGITGTHKQRLGDDLLAFLEEYRP